MQACETERSAGLEKQRKGQRTSTLGKGAGNKHVPWEVTVTARNAGVTNKSAASSMESKGCTDAEMSKFGRRGGVIGSYKEKWASSRKDKKEHLGHCLHCLAPLWGGRCHLGKSRFGSRERQAWRIGSPVLPPSPPHRWKPLLTVTAPLAGEMDSSSAFSARSSWQPSPSTTPA